MHFNSDFITPFLPICIKYVVVTQLEGPFFPWIWYADQLCANLIYLLILLAIQIITVVELMNWLL